MNLLFKLVFSRDVENVFVPNSYSCLLFLIKIDHENLSIWLNTAIVFFRYNFINDKDYKPVMVQKKNEHK